MREELKIDNDQATKEMLESEEYKYGFTTEVDQEIFPKGLNEDIVRKISAKKNEPKWLLDFRLNAYKRWLRMEDPDWAKLNIDKIDYNEMSYFTSPKKAPDSLDDIDPEIATASEKSKVEAKARPSTGTSDWLLAVSSTQSMVPSLEK